MNGIFFYDNGRQDPTALRDGALFVLGHEVGHRWHAGLRYLDEDGVERPLADGHWYSSVVMTSTTTDRQGRPLRTANSGGGAVGRIDDTTFLLSYGANGFSLLELWVMGMIPAEQVPDLWVLDVAHPWNTVSDELNRVGQTLQPLHEHGYPEPHVFEVPGSERVTIEQIEASEGTPPPAKELYRFPFVLLHLPGEEPTAAALHLAENMRIAWTEYFQRSTLGIGRTSTALGVEDVAPSALALSQNHNGLVSGGSLGYLDGSWSADANAEPIASYHWLQVAGPAVVLSDPESATPRFIAPDVDEPRDLRFRLVVADEGGKTSAPDEVTMRVLPDLRRACPGTVVHEHFDHEGDIAKYQTDQPFRDRQRQDPIDVLRVGVVDGPEEACVVLDLVGEPLDLGNDDGRYIYTVRVDLDNDLTTGFDGAEVFVDYGWWGGPYQRLEVAGVSSSPIEVTRGERQLVLHIPHSQFRFPGRFGMRYVTELHDFIAQKTEVDSQWPFRSTSRSNYPCEELSPPLVLELGADRADKRYSGGERIRYQVRYRNCGLFPLTDDPASPEIRLDLPAEIKPLEVAIQSGGGLARITGQRLTWNGTLEPGASVELDLEARVAPDVRPLTLANVATAFADLDGDGQQDLAFTSDDPTTSGYRDPLVLVLDGSVSLLEADKVLDTALAPGALAHYRIVLHNPGAAAVVDAPGHEMVDVLPEELELVSARLLSGTGVVATQIAQKRVTWNGGLAAGASAEVEITVRVLAQDGDIVANQALLSYDRDRDGSHDTEGVSDDPSTSFPGDPTAAVVGPKASTCTGALCLDDGRFSVDLRWRDGAGNSGLAQAASLRSDDSGLLYFFDPLNWEVLVKILDGCGLNGRYWVFAAATTDLEYALEVTHVASGARKTYTNAAGTASRATADTNAFATCGDGLAAAPAIAPSDVVFASSAASPRPDGAVLACDGSSAGLCLAGDRFDVTVEWTTSAGATGIGTAVSTATDNSGVIWFFDAGNWEMLFKVLDGCALNGHYWVFAAATTDVGYALRVADTITGEVKTYRNQAGVSAPALTDTKAFASCP